MLKENLINCLRFYFITDDGSQVLSPLEQVKIAIAYGATMIQYRNKTFVPHLFEEVLEIRNLCKCNGIPFIINDNILLAKAVVSDGVHLGQRDDAPILAREILGPTAIIGMSVSTPDELKRTDLTHCDYIGTGPVFTTTTKSDAKEVIGLKGLKAVVDESPVPVVGIGGIDAENAKSCFMYGAEGVAVISCITRAENPEEKARSLGQACGCSSRPTIASPWNDEFSLIKKLVEYSPPKQAASTHIRVPPGDDAALLGSLSNPVVTTDTQEEDIHFSLYWQSPEEIGFKAVEITLSDLAASYATPISLFINLGLPSYVSDDTAEALYKGIHRSLTKHGCELGGGNISKSFRLSIDLFAIGQGRDDLFPKRSVAKPGDGLYCTGPLGLSRAGLESLIRKDTLFKNLIEKFKFPSARFDAADILAEKRITCVTDISDGLAGDAAHIAEASHLSIVFDLQSGTFHPELIAYCDKYHQNVEDMVLAGGEDYELLFTCTPETFDRIKKKLPDAFQVGSCIPFNGKFLPNLPASISSFQHGKS